MAVLGSWIAVPGAADIACVVKVFPKVFPVFVVVNNHYSKYFSACH